MHRRHISISSDQIELLIDYLIVSLVVDVVLQNRQRCRWHIATNLAVLELNASGNRIDGIKQSFVIRVSSQTDRQPVGKGRTDEEQHQNWYHQPEQQLRANRLGKPFHTCASKM